MSTEPEWPALESMVPDDYARALAYRAEQARILEARRRAARALLASYEPAKAVRAAWHAVAPARNPGTKPGDLPPGVLVASGHPDLNVPNPAPESLYMDQDTGILYEAQEATP